MSRLQKILAGIAFIIIVIVLGFILYTVFFQPLVPGGENSNAINGNGGLPEAGENRNIQILPGGGGTLPGAGEVNGENANAQAQAPSGEGARGAPKIPTTPLTSASIYFPAPSADGSQVNYYNRQDGKFYKISPDGKTVPLSDKIFFQAETIRWSPDASKVALEYPDGANIIYDFKTKKQITLPSHWTEFNFSPDGNQVVSKTFGLNPENNFLIISDSTGTKTKIIRELGTNGDRVIAAWSPSNQVVGLFHESSDFDKEEIYFIGQNNENFKSMPVEGVGFQGKWTPQGDKILYSVHSSRTDNKPELWIVDAAGDSAGRNRRQLKLQTWADKCSFNDNNTLYCAVPSRLENGAGYYPDEMDNAPDSVYKINLNTGSKTLVAETDTAHTMKNLIVSRDGKYLFFTDKNDGKLYKVQLK